jgi:hypothetical protein
MRSGSTVVGHKNKNLGKGSGGKMWFAMGNNLAEPMEHDNCGNPRSQKKQLVLRNMSLPN